MDGRLSRLEKHKRHRGDSMIITIEYAKRLVKAGKATIVTTCDSDGDTYIVLNRHDLQRTDHAKVTP